MDLLADKNFFENLFSNIDREYFNDMFITTAEEEIKHFTLNQLSILKKSPHYHELFSGKCFFTARADHKPTKLSNFVILLVDAGIVVCRDTLSNYNLGPHGIIFKLELEYNLYKVIKYEDYDDLHYPAYVNIIASDRSLVHILTSKPYNMSIKYKYDWSCLEFYTKNYRSCLNIIQLIIEKLLTIPTVKFIVDK